jgi:quercetin dioxygenase-like cupin family protein
MKYQELISIKNDMFISKNAADMIMYMKPGEKIVFKKNQELSLIVHKGEGELSIGKRRVKLKEKSTIISKESTEKIIVAITSMLLFVHIEAIV